MKTLLRLLYILCILTISLSLSYAQDMELHTSPAEDVSYETTQDSVRPASRRQNPDKLFDIRYQLEQQNKNYYAPSAPTPDMIQAMRKKGISPSEEVLFWSRNRMDPSNYFSSVVNFTDTVIYNPFLLPPVFRRNYIRKQYTFGKPEILPEKFRKYNTLDPDTIFFEKERRKIDLQKRINNHIAIRQPQYFKYTEEDLPDEIIQIEMIKKAPADILPLNIKPEKQVTEIAPPAKFIPDRLYWTSQFESAVQFSQNYVSPNWHKGGSSNLNLYTKNNIKYNYNRDKIQFTNELEDKISIYNATKDTLHRYKVGEDLLRIYSNFGYQAFNRWYYTIDGEFRTQLLKSYEENTETQLAGFLAPMSINLGVGMKYDLFKEFQQKGKNLQLTVNLAPLSYTYMYSRKKDIDLGRHGFQKDEETDEFKNTLSQVGSTIRTDMTVNFSPNITWQSRLYYFTTYEKAICEFENTLVLAITRHFSTRIYMHIRFDDSVTKTEDFDSYFQVNELLSFGFNYKW